MMRDNDSGDQPRGICMSYPAASQAAHGSYGDHNSGQPDALLSQATYGVSWGNPLAQNQGQGSLLPERAVMDHPPRGCKGILTAATVDTGNRTDPEVAVNEEFFHQVSLH